jgi:type 1 glutamine amidotransferase
VDNSADFTHLKQIVLGGGLSLRAQSGEWFGQGRVRFHLVRQSLIIGVVAGLVACSAPAAQPTSSVDSTSLSTPPTTSPTQTTATTTTPIRVLVFYKTAGFRHDSIPVGIEAVTALGEEHGFAVSPSDDASIFTEAGLSGFEVIVFLNTTGDILESSEEQAMEGFIRDGNGFVGIHSATDTEYAWAWYGELVGTYVEGHPAIQPATVNIVAPGHPIMDGLPAAFDRVDEWYNFRDVPEAEVTVLATLDETTYQGGTMGEDHPITWAHEYDGGRSFYTAMGHTEESYTEPLFIKLLGNAILWVSGEGQLRFRQDFGSAESARGGDPAARNGAHERRRFSR